MLYFYSIHWLSMAASLAISLIFCGRQKPKVRLSKEVTARSLEDGWGQVKVQPKEEEKPPELPAMDPQEVAHSAEIGLISLTNKQKGNRPRMYHHLREERSDIFQVEREGQKGTVEQNCDTVRFSRFFFTEALKKEDDAKIAKKKLKNEKDMKEKKTKEARKSESIGYGYCLKKQKKT